MTCRVKKSYTNEISIKPLSVIQRGALYNIS